MKNKVLRKGYLALYSEVDENLFREKFDAALLYKFDMDAFKIANPKRKEI